MSDVTEVDALDGTVIERDFTPEEKAQRTADQQANAAAKAITDALDGNRVTLTDRATSALDLNRDYLEIATPTNAQISAQVKALTRQSSALIRLLTDALDATD